jgi:hypothetical protein
MSVVVAGLMVLASILILLGVMYKKMAQMTVQMPMPQPVSEPEADAEAEVNRLNELIAEYIKQRNTGEAKAVEESLKEEVSRELKALNIAPKQERAVAMVAAAGTVLAAAPAEKRPVAVIQMPERRGKTAPLTRPETKLKKPEPSFQIGSLLPIEKSFYFKHPETGVGMYARSLDEFHQALKALPQETYNFHMREDQNDFSNWLKHILNEHELAAEIDGIKQMHGEHKEKIVGAVEKRVSERHQFGCFDY